MRNFVINDASIKKPPPHPPLPCIVWPLFLSLTSYRNTRRYVYTYGQKLITAKLWPETWPRERGIESSVFRVFFPKFLYLARVPPFLERYQSRVGVVDHISPVPMSHTCIRHVLCNYVNKYQLYPAYFVSRNQERVLNDIRNFSSLPTLYVRRIIVPNCPTTYPAT